MKRIKRLLHRPKASSNLAENEEQGLNEASSSHVPPPPQNSTTTSIVPSQPSIQSTSNKNPKEFTYTPLKHPRDFRILNLQRKASEVQTKYSDLTLQGTLVEAALDEPPQYYALSYTWGSPDFTFSILIDGMILKITENCALALRRMLRGESDRLIWVDSICINQSTDAAAVEERSSQVEMMGEIYRRAVQVNVYLGPGDAASDVACAALKGLSRAYIMAQMGGPMKEAGKREYERLADDVLKTTPEYPYGKLYGVFKLPWFRRAWVLQEVAMAQNVMFYCGDYILHFIALSVGADFTRLPYSKPSVGASHWKIYLEQHSALQEFIRRKDQGEPVSNFGLTLLGILSIPALGLEASRPADKVYSLYGICKTLGFELPAPDYKKSVATIYTEATRAIIQQDNNLGVLSFVEGSAGSEFDLPSWVANFSGNIHQWTTQDPPRLRLVIRDNVMVSGASTLQYQFQPDGRGFKIKGRRLDHLVAVSEAWKLDNSTNMLGNADMQTGQYAGSLVDCIGSWTAVIQNRADNPQWETILDDLVHLLMTDLSPGPYPAESKANMIRYLDILIQRSHAQDNVQKTHLYHPLDDVREIGKFGNYFLSTKMHAVIAELRHAAWEAVFRTSSGYLGTGSFSAQVGDVAVVLHGSSTPCLIRPCEGGYRYVGAAYVDGIMRGEFWEWGVEDEWFVLV